MAEAGIYLLLQRRHWVTEENCGVFSERSLRIKQAPLCVLYLEPFRHHLSTISGADQESSTTKLISEYWERKTPYSEITEHYASWDSGRGQLLAVISGIHLFKQCHQHFWIADVCFEAGPGDEHALPFDKGKGGSWRKAGLCHTTGLFQRLQGDRGEVLGCFHCQRRGEPQMWQGAWLSHALGCSGRQRREAGTGSREIAFGR